MQFINNIKILRKNIVMGDDMFVPNVKAAVIIPSIKMLAMSSNECRDDKKPKPKIQYILRISQYLCSNLACITVFFMIKVTCICLKYDN